MDRISSDGYGSDGYQNQTTTTTDGTKFLTVQYSRPQTTHAISLQFRQYSDIRTDRHGSDQLYAYAGIRISRRLQNQITNGIKFKYKFNTNESINHTKRHTNTASSTAKLQLNQINTNTANLRLQQINTNTNTAQIQHDRYWMVQRTDDDSRWSSWMEYSSTDFTAYSYSFAAYSNSIGYKRLQHRYGYGAMPDGQHSSVPVGRLRSIRTRQMGANESSRSDVRRVRQRSVGTTTMVRRMMTTNGWTSDWTKQQLSWSSLDLEKKI